MNRYTSLPGALYRRWQHYRKVHRELSLFNDRDLLDLGLRRNDISHVAHAAAVALVWNFRSRP